NVKVVTEDPAFSEDCAVGYVYQPGARFSVSIHMTVWPRLAWAGSIVTDADGTAFRKALFFVGGGASAAFTVESAVRSRKTGNARKHKNLMRSFTIRFQRFAVALGVALEEKHRPEGRRETTNSQGV